MKTYLCARAEQAAESLRLGKPVAEYQQGVTPSMKGLIYSTMGLALLLLIGIPISVILLFILTPYPFPGSFIVFVLTMAITLWLLLLGTTIWAWYCYWSDPWGVLLYTEGFVGVRMRRVRGRAGITLRRSSNILQTARGIRSAPAIVPSSASTQSISTWQPRSPPRTWRRKCTSLQHNSMLPSSARWQSGSGRGSWGITRQACPWPLAPCASVVRG